VKKLLAVFAVLAVLAAGCGSSGEFEHVADTPENRAIAAERYEAAMPVEMLLEELVYSMSDQLPPEHRESFLDHMVLSVDVEGMRDITHEAMVRHFTADELNAQAVFYESAEGKSVSMKSREYMSDLMPKLQNALAAVAQQWEPAGVTP